MSSDDQLNKLTDTINTFIIENTKVITTLSVNQEGLIESVREISDASRKAIESNTRLEVKMEAYQEQAMNKIQSLEERAIDKAELVEDSVNDISVKVDEVINEVKIIDKRTHALELINANEAGIKEGEDKKNGHWAGMYARVVVTGGLIIGIATFIYNVFIKTGTTP